MSDPLVTCLCLTHNRRQWLPIAIQCFLRQTYAERELLIVASGKDPVVDLIPPDSRIRVLITDMNLNIGAKRNIGCDSARSEIVAHWDDDDYSAPLRLASQVRRLQDSGKAVTGYNSLKFTDGRNWWRYHGGKGFALGTSLCYRRDWWQRHEFPDMHMGEDSVFVSAAVRENQLACEPDADLMYATNHSGNTTPRVVTNRHNGMWVPLPGFEWREAA